MPNLTFNTRPKSLSYYENRRFFAADLGLNLSCFVGLLFAQGLIFSEKKTASPKNPI